MKVSISKKNLLHANSSSSTMPLPKVLVLVGPTCSGKTSVSLLLAAQLEGEIISADSRQIFRYMDIGTAKPRSEALEKVKHYFVDERMPDEDFDSGEFGRLGRSVIADVAHRHKTPIVVGGSGLYVQSLIDGFFEGPPKDQGIRSRLRDELKIKGGEGLMADLRKVDPEAAERMLPSNTRRIIRALEVYAITELPLTEHHRRQQPIRQFDPVFVGLDWKRPILYDRINTRVDQMISDGLVEEVRSILHRGIDPRTNALQTVGYKEVIDHLAGLITFERMVELIKQNSRRYAKRQLTWFRRDVRITWFPISTDEEILLVSDKIMNHFRDSPNG